MSRLKLFCAGTSIGVAMLIGGERSLVAGGAPPTGAVALGPCSPESAQPAGSMCGEISVPENRALKGGRRIALQVVVLPGRSAGGRGNPIFAIAGGPGVPSTRLAVTYPRLYDALQAEHDVVLVDQRGAGGAQRLACWPVDLTRTPEKAFNELPDSKSLTACRDRLVKQADLTQYTTAAAVDDLDASRQALGYTRINLLGISYGTRVALEYLRRHEASVRAIALTGVISPGYRIGLHGTAESQRALKQLFAMCAADAACNGAFPNVASELDAVLTRLEKAPASASIPLSANTPPLTLTISRAVFARELFQLLHYREDWTALPLVIHHASTNDFTPFAGLALEREASRPPQADGMALSVTCAQDAPFITPAALASAARGTFLRTDRGQYLTRACGVWPHASPDTIATTPVRAGTPALLISGTLDPTTPKEYAAEVAQTLPNALHVVVANVAHVPANPCVNGLVVAFMASGSSKGLDAACAARFPPLKFLTKVPTPR